MTSTPSQLRLAADIIETNAQWDFAKIMDANEWLSGMELYESPLHAIYHGRTIRLKPWALSRHLPGFRPLLDGEQWHREDWQEEWLPEGWRPLLKGEVIAPGPTGDEYESEGAVKLRKADFHWQSMEPQLPDESDFWRTRRPLPEYVPLEPQDVPPGSYIKRADENSWFQVTGTGDGLVYFGNTGTRTYRALMDNAWMILRPGSSEWTPCRKLAPEK